MDFLPGYLLPAENSSRYQTTNWGDMPAEFDNLHTPYSRPVISVLEPNSSRDYTKDERVSLKISSSGRFPLSKIDIFINDIYIDTIDGTQSFSFIPSDIENLREKNVIKIIVYDSAYNKAETESFFTVSD